MEQAKRDGSCQEWDQGILLELVRKDWSITLSLGTDCEPLLSIGNGDVEA
jgi:hypothetical protein